MFVHLIIVSREALGLFGCADAISLVSGRDEVDDLLKLDNYIDLIIPRGSNELVRSEPPLTPVLKPKPNF